MSSTVWEGFLTDGLESNDAAAAWGSPATLSLNACSANSGDRGLELVGQAPQNRSSQLKFSTDDRPVPPLRPSSPHSPAAAARTGLLGSQAMPLLRSHLTAPSMSALALFEAFVAFPSCLAGFSRKVAHQ